MALVRVCDRCMKLIEGKDYINIEYNKRLDGSILPSHITLTLCEECFEKEYGKGHLESMINQYQMSKWNKKVENEKIGELQNKQL